MRRTTVSRPSAFLGRVRRGTGAGEARDEANAATRSWGTLALKVAHHRYALPKAGSAHACQPTKSGRGSASSMSGGSISSETEAENPGSMAVVRGRSTSRIQPRAVSLVEEEAP